MREVISTKDGPQAIGPYSQAIRANGFVFVSGQVAIDPATQQVVTGDVAAQTERVLKNLSGILKAAGSGLERALGALLSRTWTRSQRAGPEFRSDAVRRRDVRSRCRA